MQNTEVFFYSGNRNCPVDYQAYLRTTKVVINSEPVTKLSGTITKNSSEMAWLAPPVKTNHKTKQYWLAALSFWKSYPIEYNPQYE